MRNRPIGIFDSGLGGISIWKEIHKLLPLENTIYLADSKNAPYGEKGKDQILQLSIKNTELLLKKGCKLIVVACNTATTNAISYLRENYEVPFIGIEPAIKPAALQSRSMAVGILATKGTLSSNLFHSTAENHANGIVIIEQEGEGLVPLIEAGDIYSEDIKKLLQQYLTPMLTKNIDCLVLGCTHYSYLIPILREMLPDYIKIIDSGEAVAKQTSNILQLNNLSCIFSNEETHRFYTNSDKVILKNFLTDVEVDHQTEYLDF